MIRAQTEVIFYTTQGDFNAEIYDNIVPITGGNFLDLVGKKYYDGIIFHRVINNFMIQGGDPTGTGSGGPGYSIADEFDPTLSNVATTISMANSGPNTGGSQFFINLVDNTYLDYNKPPLTSKHPVFGKVTQNFNIVQAIGLVATDGNDRPLVDVVMDSVRVVPPVWAGVKNESNTNLSLNVYPNPINSSSVLVVSSKYSTGAKILIHDVLGKEVFADHIELNTGRNEIGLSSLSRLIKVKGIYQMSINTGNKIQRISIVVP
jgi:peptidylprolyl isomerase